MADEEDITSMNEITAAWLRQNFAREQEKRAAHGEEFSQGDLADELSAALKKRVNREAINRMMAGTQKFEFAVVVKMAQLFESELPINLSVAPNRTVGKIYVLRNSVAIGVWREEDKVMNAPSSMSVKITPIPAYEGLEHFARYVEDGHADTYVPKYFYVLTVNYQEARQSLNHGDNVIIERRRTDLSDKGQILRELSIRRLIKNGDKWLLQSLCSVPNVVPDHEYDGDTDELLIRELIVHRFA
jgi:hypothetical protein